MNREIDLSPYKEISINTNIIHQTLIDEATIIIEIGDDYYFIKDDIEKIKDVSKMPSYIKEDWIKYNKKELTYNIINQHIREYLNKSESQYSNDDILEILSTLKAIKRQLIIKNLI